ncbi:MarR family transcriptional regulator [Acrocarpospora pleiomorpha]|uniref:MarR family transcriptional regulator n=1 Tax=Acrocarpospora pleiomorpha TaxID=90975 RepID=A0A5M3XE98_9ACTN|nr:transcriptional regulator [Acrocarpospora pleiomorpha]GES19082.1 MarR family transcriptional regulator [Acrocarpospora pleiomorpha]
MTEPNPGTRRTHPRHDLDDLLTHAVRLSIVAALADVDRAEFALVRDSVEITDPMLSKQIALLEQAGYVGVDKGRVGRRTRTWLTLTPDGQAAYRRHIHALQAIAGLAPNADARDAT